MFTPIQQILPDLRACEGKSVSVNGRILVGQGNVAFMAENYACYAAGDRLELHDADQVVQHMYSTIPAGGGGKVTYYELAYVSGTIKEIDGDLKLTDLTYCRILTDDHEFDTEVPLSPT